MDAPLANGHLATRSWLRLAVAAALVLVLILTLEASPAAGASRKPCRVRNTDSGQVYTRLQAAVDAASTADRLTVRGTCRGTTVLDRDLVIQGVRTRHSGTPILSGAGRGRVVKIEARRKVKMRDLVIERGVAQFGGGIRNEGNLTLRDVVVRRCEGQFSGKTVGGIFNRGRLRLNGTSSIRGNGTGWEMGYGPGGVWNTGTFTMNGSSAIRGSWTDWIGGSGVWNEGTFTMNGSASISGSADVGAQNEGTFRMNESSSIHGNPGGVWNHGALTMNDHSTIRGNSLSRVGAGGGVFVAETATFTMNDHSTIRGNSHSRVGAGGGVYVAETATFTMNDHSTIRRNAVSGNGGGVFVAAGGTLRMNDGASIAVNSADLGGGVYISVQDQPSPGTVILRDASSIRNNTAQGGKAGGVHVGAGVLRGGTCGSGGRVRGNAPDDCYGQ